MFCTECGHRWAPDEIASARFCAECGAPREDLPATPPANASVGAPPAFSHSQGPLSSLTPTFVAPTFAPAVPALTTSPTTCTQCFIPFADPDAAFCGECGHPRPVASSTARDDEDLFGASSTAYAAPPAASAYTAAPAYTAASSYSSYSSDLSNSSFGPPSASVGYDAPHSTIAPPAPATSFQNYGVQPSPAYVPYSEPVVPVYGADPNSPPATVDFNAVPSSVNSISSLLSSLSGTLINLLVNMIPFV